MELKDVQVGDALNLRFSEAILACSGSRRRCRVCKHQPLRISTQPICNCDGRETLEGRYAMKGTHVTHTWAVI